MRRARNTGIASFVVGSFGLALAAAGWPQPPLLAIAMSMLLGGGLLSITAAARMRALEAARRGLPRPPTRIPFGGRAGDP